MAYRIVISGYYGCGNIGDEAVLAGMLETFRRVRLDAKVTVLSNNPADTAARHPSVGSIHRYAVPSLLRALSRADLVISGGGSLLQDVTSARSLRYYLFVLRVAQALGRKTMVYAQGVGPLIRPASRRAAAAVLNRTDLITVRDRESAEVLRSIGIGAAAVHVTADPAFLVESDPDAAELALAGLGAGDGPMVGVSLRPWRAAGDWLGMAAAGVRLACEHIGAQLLVIPMQPEADSRLWPEVREGEAVAGGPSEVDVVKGLIGRCGLLVGMRLHSLIFAASEGVPFVPLVYDPKVSAFASAVGACEGIGVENLTDRMLADMVVEQWRLRSAARERLLALRDDMRGLALRSGELAKELLEG